MEKITLIITLFVMNLSFGQDFEYKDKQFDLKIFEYLIETTDKDSTSLESFILYSKPFSKWDIRPLKNEKVWAMDMIYSASQIPNFIWGAFSKIYNLSEKKAMDKPNAFLEKGVIQKNELSDFLKKNIKKYNELTNLILKSKNNIYLNQKQIQRIDNVYKEKNTYWNYVLSSESPYPISSKIVINEKIKFSNQQDKLLNLLNDLKIYSALKTNKGIFFIVVY